MPSLATLSRQLFTYIKHKVTAMTTIAPIVAARRTSFSVNGTTPEERGRLYDALVLGGASPRITSRAEVVRYDRGYVDVDGDGDIMTSGASYTRKITKVAWLAQLEGTTDAASLNVADTSFAIRDATPEERGQLYDVLVSVGAGGGYTPRHRVVDATHPYLDLDSDSDIFLRTIPYARRLPRDMWLPIVQAHLQKTPPAVDFARHNVAYNINGCTGVQVRRLASELMTALNLNPSSYRRVVNEFAADAGTYLNVGPAGGIKVCQYDQTASRKVSTGQWMNALSVAPDLSADTNTTNTTTSEESAMSTINFARRNVVYDTTGATYPEVQALVDRLVANGIHEADEDRAQVLHYSMHDECRYPYVRVTPGSGMHTYDVVSLPVRDGQVTIIRHADWAAALAGNRAFTFERGTRIDCTGASLGVVLALLQAAAAQPGLTGRYTYNTDVLIDKARRLLEYGATLLVDTDGELLLGGTSQNSIKYTGALSALAPPVAPARTAFHYHLNPSMTIEQLDTICAALNEAAEGTVTQNDVVTEARKGNVIGVDAEGSVRRTCVGEARRV